MIAAKRRRKRSPGAFFTHTVKNAPGRASTLSRRVDRWANGLLVRAWAPLVRVGRRVRALGARLGRTAARRLRPVAVFLFHAMGRLERLLLALAARARRFSTAASAVLTPRRAICLAILVAAGCLLAAQFADYRAVEVGQGAYAGLPATGAPTVGGETAGQAHAYLLVPVALLAGLLALVAARGERRDGVGRVVFGLGLVSLATILLVDLPAGLDVGAEAARFSGAEAVLYDGFYAEIAAAAGLMLGGALLVLAPKATARYYARPCRTRTSLLGRAASALRRRRRRRASSRARGARRGSRRRKGAVSAPASPR